MDSNILQTIQVTGIFVSPFFNIAVIFAFFHTFGKVAVFNDFLNIIINDQAITQASSFNILVDYTSCPGNLSIFRDSRFL